MRITRAGDAEIPQESPCSPINADQLTRIFKALGHPTRIRIVEHLIAINTWVVV